MSRTIFAQVSNSVPFELFLTVAILVVVLSVAIGFGLGLIFDRLILKRRDQPKASAEPAANAPNNTRSFSNAVPIAALETAPFGIVLVRADGAAEIANGRAQQLLELTAASGPMPINPFVRILREDLANAWRSPGNLVQRELRLADNRQARWQMLAQPDGTCLVFITDLTDQRRVERNYHDFLSSLSHELRTPLTAILGHIEILRGKDIAPDTRKASLNLIHQETSRIARLTDELLKLSRLEMTPSLDLRPTDVLVTAEQAISQVILRAEQKGVSLALQAGPDLPRVLADRDRLKQIFINLTDNAIKYSRPADSVTVSMERRADRVLCVIRDTGPGIKEADLPHVRKRLYRARSNESSATGTGLGLALVDELLKLHQSQLVIESNATGPQTGTIVRFDLLIADGS